MFGDLGHSILTRGPVFILAISLHEYAHALAATLCGDDTAREEGRLTLNPLSHLDPIGTIGGLLIGIGWGKPVPVDLHRMRHPVRDHALVAFAGPMSNLLQAMAWTVLGGGVLAAGVQMGMGFWTVIRIGITLNLVLMFFNLVPLHPLDGFAVACGLMSGRVSWEAEAKYRAFNQQYGVGILMLLIMAPGFLRLPPELDPFHYLVFLPSAWLGGHLMDLMLGLGR
ncbi:MAG: site-2 protease family protein [Planctomycetes bacterium]|nr:site-2 protease family protein [Planctomycetota bacterium]